MHRLQPASLGDLFLGPWIENATEKRRSVWNVFFGASPRTVNAEFQVAWVKSGRVVESVERANYQNKPEILNPCIRVAND